MLYKARFLDIDRQELKNKGASLLKQLAWKYGGSTEVIGETRFVVKSGENWLGSGEKTEIEREKKEKEKFIKNMVSRFPDFSLQRVYFKDIKRDKLNWVYSISVEVAVK